MNRANPRWYHCSAIIAGTASHAVMQIHVSMCCMPLHLQRMRVSYRLITTMVTALAVYWIGLYMAQQITQSMKKRQSCSKQIHFVMTPDCAMVYRTCLCQLPNGVHLTLRPPILLHNEHTHCFISCLLTHSVVVGQC